MNVVDKTFSESERKILEGLLDKTLLSIQGPFWGSEAWNWIRLNTDEGSIDISIEEESIIELPHTNTIEEISVLKIDDSAGNELKFVALSDTEVSKETIGETVKHVYILNEIVTKTLDEMQDIFSCTQALIIELENYSFILDRGVWFSDMIAVKKGKDVGSLLYDDGQIWTDDQEEGDELYYEYSSELVKIC